MLNTYLPIPQNPQLDFQKTLDIWQFSLNRKLDSTELASLSMDEQSRASRFLFEKHQRRFKVGRVRLRQILAQYLNQDPANLNFNYGKEGKPFLNDFLEFNLSHSGEIALLAVCLDYPVGIDIEIYSSRSFIGVGEQVFSDHENAILKKLPNKLKPLCFFHLWAQKEAVIKAVGKGFSYPTQSIQVPFLPPTQQADLQTLDGHQWKIDAFSPEVATRAAVCYHPEIQRIRYGVYDARFA